MTQPKAYEQDLCLVHRGIRVVSPAPYQSCVGYILYSNDRTWLESWHMCTISFSQVKCCSQDASEIRNGVLGPQLSHVELQSACRITVTALRTRCSSRALAGRCPITRATSCAILVRPEDANFAGCLLAIASTLAKTLMHHLVNLLRPSSPQLITLGSSKEFPGRSSCVLGDLNCNLSLFLVFCGRRSAV
jgi:hypothetical protein